MSITDKDWHKRVCERENFVCQICGKDFSAEYYFDSKGINQYVCGHHLKSKKAYPKLRFEVSNGICVDINCHNNIHSGKIKL